MAQSMQVVGNQWLAMQKIPKNEQTQKQNGFEKARTPCFSSKTSKKWPLLAVSTFFRGPSCLLTKSIRNSKTPSCNALAAPKLPAAKRRMHVLTRAAVTFSRPPNHCPNGERPF
jgi:hypothetical protein